MAYLGNDLQVAYSTYKNIDDISGSFNGSTTSFALLVGGVAPVPLPLNSQQCLISVGGVIQRPDDTGSEGFRLSGGNIVFSSAPSTGEDFFGVILAGADYVNVGANFPSGSAAVPSITFDSDLDTGIYNSAANNISIATGGTQRLVVDSSGRLGLGTSSPGAVLDVSGSGNIVRFGDGTNTFDVRFKGPNNWAVQLDTSADKFNIQRNSSSLVTVDSSGRVGIGTTTPGNPLGISQTVSTTFGNAGTYLGLGGAENALGQRVLIGFGYKGTATDEYPAVIGYEATSNAGNQNGSIVFGTRSVTTNTAPTERARIDTSGRLLVGTSSAISNVYVKAGQVSASATTPNQQFADTSNAYSGLSITKYSSSGYAGTLSLNTANSSSVGTNGAVANGWTTGVITFNGNDGTNFIPAAEIQAVVDGTPGANDMPGRLVFSTTADGASSPTERMRITNSGQVRIGSEVGTNNYSFGVELSKDNNVLALIDPNPSNSGSRVAFTIRTGTYNSSDTTSLYANFIRGDGAQRGQIRSNGAAAVAYESASDYRLKENVTPLVNATARLQQLKPYRFNFIDDGPERVVDGFFAHEVQEVIPEAAGGIKDAVDAEGNPIYQGVDQSKIVPLLTAALQEALQKIDAMEARLAALEGA